VAAFFVDQAARFVSGYLHVRDHNDDRNAGGGNTHAWVQVYLPGPGWVDFDPASGSRRSYDDFGADITAGARPRAISQGRSL
jgi:transglutaminase-like putative cysteine protease